MDPTSIMDDTDLAEFAQRFATRFEVGWHGHRICIERYSNHGRILPDGQWVVVRHLFPLGSTLTNPLYLNGSAWLYKSGQTWPSWQEALAHLRWFAARPGTNGWEQITEDPHAVLSEEEDSPTPTIP